MKIWNEMSLHSKLIAIAMLFFFVPFTIIGVVWYAKSAEVSENNAARYSRLIINQINDRLDDYFADLERFSLPFVLNPLIQDFIHADPSDTYTFYKKKNAVERDFVNVIGSRPDIINMSIVSDRVAVASTASDYQGADTYGSYAEERSNQNFTVRGIRLEDSTPILTVTRDILDPSTLEKNGLLIIDLNYRKLSDILEGGKLSDSTFVWITDQTNRVIYHPDERMLTRHAELPMEQLSSQSEYFETYTGEKGNLVIYKTASKTGWVLIAEIPINELTGSLIQLRNITILLGIILVVLAGMIFGGFAMSVTRSLLILQRLMLRAEKGDFDVRAPHSPNVQINSLYFTFNKMVSEIKRLIEVEHLARLKEKEMEIKEMESKLLINQSQINPHFLYNVLEVVNSYVIEHNVTPVSRMMAAIAKMFRYNVGNPQKTVTLLEEFEHVQTFLDIQKERYQHLHVVLNVDEETMKQVMSVRLILHPLVENIFFHGYEGHGLRPGEIEIRGSVIDGKYVLAISDKGKGMKPSVMDNYNRLFTQIKVPQIVSEHHLLNDKSIGLWNVHCRLLLTYGQGYGLFIRKSDETGTTIEVYLPWRERDV